MELLSNLNKLKLTLEDRNDYFMEPGSEYDESRQDNEHFETLSRTGHEAFKAVREQIIPASVFLSDAAVAALNKLVSEQWHATQNAFCTADYVRSSLVLVEAACSEVVKEARKELTE